MKSKMIYNSSINSEMIYDSQILDYVQNWIKDNEELIKSKISPFLIKTFDECTDLYWNNDKEKFFQKVYVLFYFYRYQQANNKIEFLNQADEFLKYFNAQDFSGYYRDLNNILKESLTYHK